MTIIKCDKCGTEIEDMNDLYVIEGMAYNRPSQMKRIELCPECYKSLLDFAKHTHQT